MRTAVATLAAMAGFALACGRGEPPTPDASPSISLPELPAPTTLVGPVAPSPPGPLSALAVVAKPETGPAAAAVRTPSPSPTTGVSSPSAAPDVPSPPATTTEAALLPQTHALPHASGAAFDARVRALWEAIVADDPSAAMTFFFPLGAYEQVKDVSNPAADWRQRLVAAYRRDIDALHTRLGPDADRARLVALDVAEPRVRWVEPGEEWNKIGYYRAFGSRLRYTNDGKERSFDVKSLISWRGEWYVVHLSGFK